MCGYKYYQTLHCLCETFTYMASLLLILDLGYVSASCDNKNTIFGIITYNNYLLLYIVEPSMQEDSVYRTIAEVTTPVSRYTRYDSAGIYNCILLCRSSVVKWEIMSCMIKGGEVKVAAK